jgi:hypothetical protein
MPTIVEDPEHPTFGDIPEVELHQPAHISTTVAGPSQNNGTTNSTQTAEGLYICHPRGHLHQYTWRKETQSSIRSKSMTRMMKLRKMKQQQRRRSCPESSKKLRDFGRNSYPS